MGLEAQASVRDELLGVVEVSVQARQHHDQPVGGRGGLCRRTQPAGMQYIVWNVAAIDGVVQERGAKIDRPLSAPGQMRTLWLVDPDGISNYFAQFAGNDNAAPAAR